MQTAPTESERIYGLEALAKINSWHSSPEQNTEINTVRLPPERRIEGPASTGKELIALPSRQLTVLRSATLGHDVQSREPLTIADIQRRSGLYVLGRSGTGKTALIVDLMDQDIRNGHGVFLLDPHDDAIGKLISRADSDLLQQAILLDPEDDKYAFGINLLACDDPKNRRERERTYARVKAVFDKLFYAEDTPGLYYGLIIQNALRVLIENQQYTLAELPLFLDPGNPTFRDHVLASVSEEKTALDYWHDRFPKREDERRRLVEPLLHRMLQLDEVSHVIGQRETTVDFRRLMEEQKTILVRLPSTYSSEARRFIGTMLVSELLHAARLRPESRRSQFCIFVDEFQNFVGLEDFPILFTEARKWGLATTIAHQERFGQLADKRGVVGATSAAGNKVLFSLSPADAREAAPEFADKPTPAEVRLERVYGISQEPVRDLLQGGQHPNPEIRVFVRRYLQPLKERLEDIRDDMDYERLVRMDFFDSVMLFRIEDAIEGFAYGPGSNYGTRSGLLQNASGMLRAAQQHTRNLMALHDYYRATKWTIRGFNKFFTAVMEGVVKPDPGNEEFAQFLIDRVRSSSYLPEQEEKVLELYISLAYGDRSLPRDIPLTIALQSEFHEGEAQKLVSEAERKTQQHRNLYVAYFTDYKWRNEYARRADDARRETKWRDQHSFWWDRSAAADAITRPIITEPLPSRPADSDGGYPALSYLRDSDWMNGESTRLLHGFMAWFSANSDWFEKCSDQLITYQLIERRERRYCSLASRNPIGWYVVHGVPLENTSRPLWDVKHVYEIYFWMHIYPEIRTLVEPFTSSRFTNSWRAKLLRNGVDWQIQQLRAYLNRPLGRDKNSFFRPFFGANTFTQMMRRSVYREIVQFLETHREGGLVTLAILRMAFDGGWCPFLQLEGRDPIEIYRTARNVSKFMDQQKRDLRRLYHTIYEYFSLESIPYRTAAGEIIFEPLSDLEIYEAFRCVPLDRFELNIWGRREGTIDTDIKGLLEELRLKGGSTWKWWENADEEARA